MDSAQADAQTEAAKRGWIDLKPLTAEGASNATMDGTVHDVQYYTDNPEERAQIISKCDSDPGRLDEHPNCVNARQAAWDAKMKPGNNALPKLPDNL